MRHFLNHLFVVFSHHGGTGLLILGILDSSFLVLPLGNDLLIIAMSARKHVLIPYYAFMAAAGSMLGSLTIDLLFRKGGEKELEKHVSPKRLDYVRKRINKNAVWGLVMACIMPPPFPYTPVVAAAAALQYPRRKMLSTIAGARFVRFVGEGLLSILIGKKLLRIAKSPEFEYAIGALIAVCIIGSVISVYRWVSQSKGLSRGGRPRAA